VSISPVKSDHSEAKQNIDAKLCQNDAQNPSMKQNDAKICEIDNFSLREAKSQTIEDAKQMLLITNAIIRRFSA
jgi:hypothetical protein